MFRGGHFKFKQSCSLQSHSKTLSPLFVVSGYHWRKYYLSYVTFILMFEEEAVSFCSSEPLKIVVSNRWGLSVSLHSNMLSLWPRSQVKFVTTHTHTSQLVVCVCVRICWLVFIAHHSRSPSRRVTASHCDIVHDLIFTDPNLSSDCEQHSKLAEEMSYIKVHLFFSCSCN